MSVPVPRGRFTGPFSQGVNLVNGIIVLLALAERFGKGAGFGVGLLLLPIVFLPMLAFGSATYSPAPATT